MNTPTRQLIALALGTIALACEPDGQPLAPRSPVLSASGAGVPYTEGLSSPGWQQMARTLVVQARLGPVPAARVYALLGVTQYLAVQKSQAAAGADPETIDPSGIGIGSGGRSQLEADRGAVAGASAAMLSYLFPSQADALEQRAAAESEAGPGRSHPAFAEGEAIGRAAAVGIIALAQTDGFSLPFSSTIPVGPGLWFSSAQPPQPPVGGQLPGVRPWFLTSAGQFLSAPPPTFGSPEYLAALAEIRHLSDTRTAEQTQIAISWAQAAGTPTTPGYWNVIATEYIDQRGLSEREATHVYALLHTAIFDAQIGCWTTKQTYWFIRPSQADAGITLIPVVGLPNHPSYPSGHSCLSSAATEVLAEFFPEARARLEALLEEAGLSRMYAGIHYRFDIEAAVRLGRATGRFAIDQDRSGGSVLTPQ